MNQGSISNRYYNLRQIGQGGQGTVWSAISKQTGKEVAIKLITITQSNQAAIYQEIKSLQGISYPNCIPYVACYRDSFYDPSTNQAVIEMDYIQGPTVSAYTQPLRNVGDRATLILASKLLMKAMLYGLKFIHSHGIIHNDVKPSNIVVSPEKVPVLVDFGISCHSQQAINQVCTQPYNKVIGNCCNSTAGTSIYLAPESVKNIRYPSSDLWSLGASIYEIMTGMNIWGLNSQAYDAYGLLREVVNKLNNKVLPNQLHSGDPNLDLVVNNFLSYDPSSRMTIDQALSYL